MSQDAFWVFMGILVSQIPAIIIAWRTKTAVGTVVAGVTSVKGDVTEVKGEMTALKEHVNSNTDKLVQSVKELATKTGHDEGHAAGVIEGSQERRGDDQRLVTLVTPVTLTAPAESVKTVAPFNPESK